MSWFTPAYDSRGLPAPTAQMSTEFQAGRTAGYVIGFTEAAASNKKLWVGLVLGASAASLVGIVWHAFSKRPR